MSDYSRERLASEVEKADDWCRTTGNDIPVLRDVIAFFRTMTDTEFHRVLHRAYQKKVLPEVNDA